MTRTIVALLYLQAAFFTGAYRWNHVEDEHPAREIADLAAGVLWPVYWNARFALRVTK